MTPSSRALRAVAASSARVTRARRLSSSLRSVSYSGVTPPTASGPSTPSSTPLPPHAPPHSTAPDNAASAASTVALTPVQQQSADSHPRRRARKPPVVALQLTQAASHRIHHLLSQRQPRPAGVRVSLRTRGCNGMAYVLDYAESANKFDERVTISDGTTVFIDPRALMHVVGTTMDFVDNDLVSEFVFYNPNAKGTCGCGESFNV